MNRIKNLLGIFAFSLLVLTLPTIASAQWGGNNRDRNRDRDDDYNRRNGGYYNTYQLKQMVKRLKSDSKDFAKFLDRELDRSRYDDRRREDHLNRLANDFKKAADRLEDRFDERNMYKSQNEAQNVINIANQLDRALSRTRLSSDIYGYWNNLENQVDQIARAYRYNNGRGNSGGWGDWRNKFPFPF
jgi:molecular chaperone GrpE (heat shock protein)